MPPSPSPCFPDETHLRVALCQWQQTLLGCHASLGQAQAAIAELVEQFGAETSLEELIQKLVAQDLARQLSERRARRATMLPSA
uniref:Uncharacterized protein n=1 Tax=Thermogemmatispora argillosa TaxID=2045280 RepID=A0A455T6J9_9CHLR|nr:hypothetical protein KTA_33500 [Thermogemmatispora argillosa]